MDELGTRVRSTRLEAKLTQARLGELVGLHRNWVGEVENDTKGKVPELESLERLHAVLRDVPLDQLVIGRLRREIGQSDLSPKNRADLLRSPALSPSHRCTRRGCCRSSRPLGRRSSSSPETDANRRRRRRGMRLPAPPPQPI